MTVDSPNDDEVLARILRRFLISDQFWTYGVDPDGKCWVVLDGSVVLTLEEVATLRAYIRQPE